MIGESLDLIGKVSAKGVLITTPNRFFPIIAHDTRLPLIHYLPPKARKPISKLLGREKKDSGNEFLSPLDIGRLTGKFKPVSRCLTFDNFDEFQDFHPHYVPYGAAGKGYKVKREPGPWQSAYFKVATKLLGTRSYYIMPSIKVIMVRK
jgi:hypothetical protein